MATTAPPYSRVWVLLGEESEAGFSEVLSVTTEINLAFKSACAGTKVVEVWLQSAGEAGLLALGLSLVEEMLACLELSGAEDELLVMAKESVRKLRTLTATALAGEVVG